MRQNVKKNEHSPRYVAAAANVDKSSHYTVEAALSLLKANASAKFPESVDLAVRLGIDPKKGEQNVRGITTLPHGTGKVKKVAVLAKGDQAKEATDAGADTVGDEDLIKRIQEGFRDFDVILATEEMAPQIGKIGRMLGPRTPNKRNGTVTNAIGAAVTEIKGATRLEYRADKAGVVHLGIGKAAFTEAQLLENFAAALDALIKAKPATAKGKYVKSITLSSTMGPGIKVDVAIATKVVKH